MYLVTYPNRFFNPIFSAFYRIEKRFGQVTKYIISFRKMHKNEFEKNDRTGTLSATRTSVVCFREVSVERIIDYI